MKRQKTMNRLLKELRYLWGAMILSILARLVNQYGTIALVTMAVLGLGQVLAAPQSGILGSVLILLVMIGAIKGAFHYLEDYTGHYIAFRMLTTLRVQLYQRLEVLAPAGLSHIRSGDLLARAMDDVNRIEGFYANTIAPAIVAVLVPIISLLVMAGINEWLALVFLFFLIAVGFLVPWLADDLALGYGREARTASAAISTHMTDSIQGLREVLAAGAEERRRKEVRALGERLVGTQGRLTDVAGLRGAITDALIGVSVVLLLAVGLLLHGLGQLELFQVPAALVLALTTYGPMLSFGNVLSGYDQAMASAERLFTLIDQHPAVQQTATQPPPEPIAPSIEFDQVYFRYPRRSASKSARAASNGQTPEAGPWVHAGLSLSIPAGQTVALVGVSGVGKTTVVNLLLRFWDPDQGQVRIGGHDIRNFPFYDLRRRIAVVAQNTHIFNASIKENLLLGKIGASDAEIERVARLVGLHDFITGLPDGYKTNVGELGGRLSGGQRQRLAIARALLKDAPILVLDEATSHLDAATEREIQTAIQELMRGRTTLIIAHRLSTIINADTILVLESGQIVEQGSHADLLARGGVYERLFAVQAR